MGTIADHFQLQEAQMALFREFSHAACQNFVSRKEVFKGKLLCEEESRLSCGCGGCLEIFLEDSFDNLSLFSEIKDLLLQRATNDNILECVNCLMTDEERKSKKFLFDSTVHKRYDAKFCYQRDSETAMSDAERTPDAARAFHDFSRSLTLVGLMPQIRKEDTKRCVKEAAEERKNIEDQNAGKYLKFAYLIEPRRALRD